MAPVLSAGHPCKTMVAAVIGLVGHTARHRIARGLHRMLGTPAGMSCQLLYDGILETVIGSVIGGAVALAGSALRRRLPFAATGN